MTGEDIRAQNYSAAESDIIQADSLDDIIFEEGVPVIAETQAAPTPTPIDDEPTPKASEDEINETEERIRIRNMSPEETMQFLAQSLNEINSFDYPDNDDDLSVSGNSDDSDYIKRLSESYENAGSPESPASTTSPTAQAASSQALLAAAQRDLPTVDDTTNNNLTVEPVWGDIYIKASRNLRELCENGKLTMSQIETELKEKLLEAAEQFAEVTRDESKIPKTLLPKITELKAAIGNTDPYFQLGEDIAARAMFFMLYQMLSYADRIAETPDTKEKFNDFFRRFGSAGITLSMLDVRV